MNTTMKTVIRSTAPPFAPLAALLAPVLALLLLGGCSPSGDGGPSAPLPSVLLDETLFLAQSEAPDAVMDALFEGRVTRDDDGCLRLDTPDAHTVVWPLGFSLTADDGELVVRDAGGDAVGRVGGPFRLGGGEVASLHDGIAMTPEDRQDARASCPGRYWIVGDVP